MQINLIELWRHMSLPVHLVVIVLTAQAVACIAVVIDRLVMLYTSRARSRKFAADVQQLMEERNYPEVLERITATRSNHLANYLDAGLRACPHNRDSAGEQYGKQIDYNEHCQKLQTDRAPMPESTQCVPPRSGRS